MAPSVEQYTAVDTVLAQVLSKVRLDRRAETVSTRKVCGRVSAEDLLAPADIPPFPASHWDGYAVMAGDLVGASHSGPVSLKVVGRAGPGGRPGPAISHGEAFQVMTGTPLPSGADAVVPVESAQRVGDHVAIREPIQSGSHVYAAGEDTKEGETILRKGQAIRVQDVGMLMALGFTKARVWRMPKVAVMATGSELAELGRPKPGKVVNSHSHVFLRLCERLGCIPLDLGIARDSKPEISRKLRNALVRADLILTLGGTSAGKHDYVAEAVESLGPDLLVHGIKMDRGRVTGVSVVGGKPVLIMPGPIQGAMNALLLLGLPLIDVLAGTVGREVDVPCSFSDAWEARKRYADFRKVVYVKRDKGRATAKPLRAETESMRILSDADGYVIVPENVTRIDAGDHVVVRLLPGFSFL